MEFHLVNWVIMVIICLALMAVVVKDRHLIGVPWISLVFFLLLTSIVIRRLDDIAGVFGIDIVSSDVGLLISWLVVGTLAYGKWKVHRNAAAISELRRMHLDRVVELERLRNDDEKKLGYSWDALKVGK